MVNYLVNYTLNSKNYMDMPQSEKKLLHLEMDNNEEVEPKVRENLEKIVLDPKKNNISVQIHGVYKISEEIKLKDYFVYKQK